MFTQQGPYHDLAETLRRIAGAFPDALIETESADHACRAHYDCLERLLAPSGVLEGWKVVPGNTAFVAIPVACPEGYLWFQVMPGIPFDIEFLTPMDWQQCRPMQVGQHLFDRLHESTKQEWELCRPVMEALARALDYEYVID